MTNPSIRAGVANGCGHRTAARRVMTPPPRFEFLFGPSVTHILFEDMTLSPRRIYTDGRDWPKDLKTREPTFVGYSLGNGSIPAGTAATIRWRSRPAMCVGRAPG